MILLLTCMLPFLGALAVALAARTGRNTQAILAGAATSAALVLILLQAPQVLAGTTSAFAMPWVPALGLEASLFMDPLGLMFAGLILGIGILIITYARFYLAAEDSMPRFLTFLMLFQGAMLGIVLSDNVLLLLIFWELTSLSSFLLIGFWSHKAEGRQGARMALAVTGGGGLALIAGLLILGRVAGSYNLTDILLAGLVIQGSPLYTPALVLILVGCFAKSAQFPFHFWLPRAMAAPTPVSAYLHSATMVKAGVFLLARLWPVLSGTELWFYLVATTGMVTMFVGAAIALFKDDLKALLAYSTVSHLGLLTMLLGFGTPMAAVVAVFHILNHATFKAALFMNAGIVDHEVGTRDVRRLGGLVHLMPIATTIAVVAGLSMAGLPPFNGFISKEMMLEEAGRTVWAELTWLIPLVATLAALLSAAYSFRYVSHVFFGPRRHDYPRAPHDPGAGLWGPPAVLAALVVLIGFFPATIAGPLVQPVAAAVIGAEPPYFALKMWHGFTPALFMSVLAVAGGAAVLWRHGEAVRMWQRVPVPDAKRAFDAVVAALVGASRVVTDTLHTGTLQRSLFVLFAATFLLAVEGLSVGGLGGATRAGIPASGVAVAAWLALVAGAVAVVVSARQRFLALIYISVIGLIVSLGFVYLSAPDLALTQISVEVVTILLLLLALNLLPKTPQPTSSRLRRARDAVLAGIVGAGVGWLALAVMTRAPRDPISAFHWAQAKPGGGGTNVVNVTLVDFRGFDTFGEIIVLGIAALAIYALLKTAVRGVAGRRLLAWVPETPESPERHPMMLVVASRLVLPIALVVGLFLFLRGHNLPGGGFIAGLVFSIALLVQFMASGYAWADARKRLERHTLIAGGVLVAAATGLGSLAFGAPFLTSTFEYITWPLVGQFELASALLFDVGVSLAVVGAVLLALGQLANLMQRAARLEVDAEPMDIDPTRGAGAVR
ncbi:monovalent cation/H+ antiporter subunit A [Erythrobacteraceae bacterium CFH 75059]|uniref:monovalent cation/H+ antiporter subunit A n=1 Tax=Qipengyuania thermophila TaxID=2509361 RepID=UPI001021A107|nr:monovalent cation/H+ antiporter subunit A [Qipengyuania thermophila]TCD06555.1 monovalent cation/H+ antiporter subunit A [Erythrobacteraceae bacterium CFH 75059]